MTATRPPHEGVAETCSACVAEFGGPVHPEHELLVEVDALAVEPVAGEFVRADEIKLGDLIVDENGERKFVAFDVHRDADRVLLFPAQRDLDAGWSRSLAYEPGDVFLVVRAAR